MTASGVPAGPLDALQQIVDSARELTHGLYAAIAVTDAKARVEGFVVSGLTPQEERTLKAPPQDQGPLGTMRKDGLPVRIDDLAEHARALGFPPEHPEMKTLMAVPVWADGSLRGALYVTDRDGGKPFRDADQVMLQVLARHAGNVILTRW